MGYGFIEVTKTGLLGNDHANFSLYYLQGPTKVNIMHSPQTVANNGKATWTGFPTARKYFVEENFDCIDNVYTYIVMDPVLTIEVAEIKKIEKTLQSQTQYGSITIIKKIFWMVPQLPKPNSVCLTGME